jgi:hypothetical protein
MLHTPPPTNPTPFTMHPAHAFFCAASHKACALLFDVDVTPTSALQASPLLLLQV